MKTFKLILLALVTFIVSALWMTPAAFVAPHLEKLATGVTIKGSSGTIWNGSVTQLQVKQFNLGHVRWKVLPLQSLSQLSLVVELNIDGQELSAQGLAAYAYDRTISLDNVQFEADASLATHIQPMAKLGGKFQGMINHAEIQPQGFPVVTGILNWIQGSVLFPIRLEPGNYRADISSQDETISAQIESSDAPLALTGTTSLNNQWQYQADINAKTQASAPALLTNLLRSAAGGNPAADGSVQIKRKGSIKPLVLYR